MKYRADIDGLRAIAVCTVVLYHAHLGFSGGYVGVDVFFVISGFLISSILLKRIQDGGFSYLDFWKRRIRRLVPALAALTVATALVGPFILLPEHLKDLGYAVVAQPLLLANVYYWRVVLNGYFGDPPEIRPLLHTWSLGVEEQFYLFFPLFLVVLCKFTKSRKKMALPVGFALVFTLLLSAVLTKDKHVFSYFNLPTRTWEFLLGTLLAFYNAPLKNRILRELFSLSGLALVFYSALSFDSTTVFPGTAALVPCLGTALLIWAQGNGPTLTKQVLSWPPIVKTGLISYSVYLWHWPVIAYTEYLGFIQGSFLAGVQIIVSFALGYLSWLFIETPFRKKKFLASNPVTWGIAVGYAGFCFLFGALMHFTAGFESQWNPKVLNLMAAPTDIKYGLVTDPEATSPRFNILGAKEKEEIDFLLWGDSHAMSLGAAFNFLGEELNHKGIQISHAGKPPLSKSAIGKQTAESEKTLFSLALQQVKKSKIETVFFAARWSLYTAQDFESRLQQTAKAFQELDCRVVLITDIPEQTRAVPRALALQTRFPQIPFQNLSSDSYNTMYGETNRIINSIPHCDVFQPEKEVLKWTSLERDGRALYHDEDHLTDTGALLLVDQLRPFFTPKHSVAP